MRNLTELQSELRRLSKELTELERQVEDLKPKDQISGMAANYPAIGELAGKEPIENPTLMWLDRDRRGQYLRLLCTAAALDGPISVDQLLYLCRLAVGAGHEAEPEDLAVMAYQTDYLDWKAAAYDLKQAALPLMLDALLVMHLAGRDSDRGLAFAAELAALLGVENGDMEVCAQLSAALLAQDYEAFKGIGTKRSYSELGYAVPVQWLENAKVMCGRYKVSEAKPTKWKDNVGSGLRWMRLFATPDARIKADEIKTSGHYVDMGCELVRFHAKIIPLRDSDGTEISFSKDNYILPKPDPIRASCSGFVRYSSPAEGEREVWITSPFDQL